MSTKENIRNSIFTNKQYKKLNVEAFGVVIEIRQPSLGDILSMQEEVESKKMIVHSLINYCYVPGTEEKLFSDADYDLILGMPFDDNFEAIQKAILDLTGVNVDVEKKD